MCANAAEYHTRAAEHARTRMAHEAVLDHVRRRWHCWNSTPGAGTRLAALAPARAREATLDIQGDRARAARRHRSDGRACRGAGRRPATRPRGLAAKRVGATDRGLRRDGSRRAAGRRMGGRGRVTTRLRLLAQRMLAMSLAFQGRPAEGRSHRGGGSGRGARAGAAPRRGPVPECARRDARDAERRRRRASAGPAIARRPSGGW